MTAVGTHCICELYGCSREALDDLELIRDALREGVHLAGATLLSETFHKFAPQGVTALGLLSESHISIHTWPESGYAAVDCFTCGDTTVPEKACVHLGQRLGAQRSKMLTVDRASELTADDEARFTPCDRRTGTKAARREVEELVLEPLG